MDNKIVSLELSDEQLDMVVGGGDIGVLNFGNLSSTVQSATAVGSNATSSGDQNVKKNLFSGKNTASWDASASTSFSTVAASNNSETEQSLKVIKF